MQAVLLAVGFAGHSHKLQQRRMGRRKKQTRLITHQTKDIKERERERSWWEACRFHLLPPTRESNPVFVSGSPPTISSQAKAKQVSDPLPASMAMESSPSTLMSKVEQLRPYTLGYTLQLMVLSAKPVQVHSRPAPGGGGGRGYRGQQQMRIAECIVGDDTGVVVFTARNDQVDVMEVGATVEVKNAKVDMYKGSMRLAVDRRGTLNAAESPAELKVKEDNNLSLIEFEQISMVM